MLLLIVNKEAPITHSSKLALLGILFIGFSLFPFSLFANHFYQHYTVANGLPSNHITYLYKDRYGFLWIGTSNGLSQYDGFTFRNYLNNPNDSTSLPNNNIRSIIEDKSGRLWLGFWGGVGTFDPKTQKFERIKLEFEQNYDKVMHLFVDSKDRIWIATTMGHYLFNIQGKLIKHWRAGKGKHDLPRDHIVQTMEDAAGNIWVTGRCGLCRYREGTKDFEVILDNNPPYLEKNEWLYSVNEGIAAKDGTFWFGSWANGLRRIDPKTHNYTSWLTKPEFAGHGAYNVISATAEFDGKIWVASHDQGLGYLDEKKDKLVFLKDLPIQGYNLPTGKTSRLLADEQVLWIGTPNGMYKYDLRKQLFEVYKIPDLKTGSCLAEIQSVAQLKPNELMLCTWTCGLFSFNTESITNQKLSVPLSKQQGSVWDLDIKHVLAQSDSTYWISTSHGLLHLNQGNWRIIKPDESKEDLSAENYFYKTIADQHGNIWAATARGILKISPRTLKFQVYLLKSIATQYDKLTSDEIIDLDVAPNGDIWFLRHFGGKSSQIAFTVLRKSTGRFVTYVAGQGKFKDYPFHQSSYNLEAASDGSIFVSSERGLTRFNGTSPQKFEAYTSYNGLLADNCHDLEEDNLGKLWILASEGISCFDLKTNKIKAFTESDGLPQAENYGLSKLPSGKLAIGHKYSWLSVLMPERLEQYKSEADYFKFTSLRVESKNLWPGDSLTISPEANVVRLSFSPLNFITSLDQIFTISINRSGKITTYQTSSNEITLSDLRPGWYEIKVSAPGLKTIDLSFYKKPHFWQTTWFLVVSIALGFGVLTILLLYRQRKILEKQQQESNLQFQIADMQMTALRSQIDAHFIFNALNTINNFIWQKLPEQASDYLTQFARLMRINLEHTRNNWIDLEDELRAIEYYFNLEALALEQTPELIWDKKGLDQNVDLLIPPMLLQPIVENVFKHAFQRLREKGLLLVSLETKGELLTFTARDNGHGPKLDSKKGSHNSLATKIMNDRLALLNKSLGTKATFELFGTEIEGKNYTISKLTIPYKLKQSDK